MPESPCLVCGNKPWEPLWDVLQRCPSCGFVTARLDAEVHVRSLYEGGYFTGEEYMDYLADEGFFRRTFRRRLREIRQQCSGGRLLEIGAAYGFFLDLAREHFDTVGFELNEQAARHARHVLQLDVRTSEFLQVDVSDIGGPVDVTVMWDVVEHLARPDEYLAHVAELSRPGARLFLTTGDIGSGLARFRGHRWRMIHPPSHLHYFSRDTIGRLLDRCGFETIEIRSIGVARSFRQILYSVLVLGLGLKRFNRAVSRFIPGRWGFTLNTGDIMQVSARRRG